MKKKKILIAIDSFAVGGAERSLISLLWELDYMRYDVELQLFGYGGEYERYIPEMVKVLPPLPYTEYCMKFRRLPIKHIFNRKFRSFLISRIRYSVKIRKEKGDEGKYAVQFWHCTSKHFVGCREKKYDIAVAYGQGTPTFYISECVVSDKKFAWINARYHLEGSYKEFAKKCYDQFDKIVCVSEINRQQEIEAFSFEKSRVWTIHDIINPEFIKAQAQEVSDADCEMCDGKGWKILTVARLAEVKGIDIAVKAAYILKKRNICFCWYVIGAGEMERRLRKLVNTMGLNDYFILLGKKVNPYPYFKRCDIYVHSSRSEGFGLALAEARVLGKPVVTTAFDSAKVQITNEKNGILTDIKPESLAEGIIKMCMNDELRNAVIKNQKNEKIKSLDEIRKIESLFNEDK